MITPDPELITSATLDAFMDYHAIDIIDSKVVGDYQGDEILVVRSRLDGRFGYLVHGYGSCSGCDVLQGFYEDLDRADPDITEWGEGSPEELQKVRVEITDYAARVVGSIDWYPSADAISVELINLSEGDADENYWWSYEDEYRTAFRELAAAALLYESTR